MALPHVGQGADAGVRLIADAVTYAELFTFCLVILGVIGVVLNAKKK